jgi:hypothetical protein
MGEKINEKIYEKMNEKIGKDKREPVIYRIYNPKQSTENNIK